MRSFIALVPLLLMFSASSRAATCPDVKNLADRLHEIAVAVQEAGQVSDEEKAKLRQVTETIGAIAEDYNDDGLRQGVKQMWQANDKDGFVAGMDNVVKELDEAYAENCGGKNGQ